MFNEMPQHIPKKVPQAVRAFTSRRIDRREFLRRLTGFSALVLLPFPVSAQGAPSPAFLQRNPAIFNEAQWRLLKQVQQHLFPATPDSPGAADLNAAPYLQWVIADPNMDEEITTFLKNGVQWTLETLQEKQIASFDALSEAQRESFLREIEQTDWGQNWLALLLLFIFEALLTDPIYGANPDGVGWEWLNHHPGYPRPTPQTRYGKR